MVAEAQYWFCCGGLGSIRSTGSEEGRVGTEGAGREREVLMPPVKWKSIKGRSKQRLPCCSVAPAGDTERPRLEKPAGFLSWSTLCFVSPLMSILSHPVENGKRSDEKCVSDF